MPRRRIRRRLSGEAHHRCLDAREIVKPALVGGLDQRPLLVAEVGDHPVHLIDKAPRHGAHSLELGIRGLELGVQLLAIGAGHSEILANFAASTTCAFVVIGSRVSAAGGDTASLVIRAG
jgi:hypothetical protein